MKGVPLKAVQEPLGHSTLALTKRYAHLTPDVRRDAVDALNINPARQGQCECKTTKKESENYLLRWCRRRDLNPHILSNNGF